MDRPARLVARLSRLLDAAWRSGMARRPELVPDVILAHARRREGRGPSDGPWLGRLGLLCDALEGEAALNSLGRTIAYGQLVRIVAARARAERLWARHPDILDRPVPPLIAIVGQMRSGTTRMHRLMACDPALATTRLVDSLEPIPPRGLDLRAAKARAGLGFLVACNPALAAIHPTDPHAPEEEFGFHAFSLWGAQFEGQWWVPSFARACEAAAGDDVQRDFAALLKTVGWARGIAPDRPWVVKAPQFAQDLAAMRRAFPGMAVIRLTRDPAAVVASGASLAWHQARVQSDRADPHRIGAEWLRKTQLREQRMRAAFADAPPAIALDYAEVSRDWRGAILDTYRALGLPLSAPALAAMDDFIEQADRHRGHHYSLAQFGLDEGRVRAALA